MGPESYGYYQNPPDPNAGFRKKLVLLLVFVIVATVVLIALHVFSSHRTTTTTVGNTTYVTKSSQAPGTMKITASGIPDANGLSAALNKSPLNLASLVRTGSFNKNLPAGSYTLQITKPGYQPFRAQFSIAPAKTTILAVNLQPVANTTITSWSQVQADGDPAQYDTPAQYVTNPHPTVTVNNVQYFYNQTWAFITTFDGSQYGYEVAKYNPRNNKWIGVAGTEQFFSNSQVYSMPGKVQSYLINNGFTYIGAQ